jgi:hypothetical protein
MFNTLSLSGSWTLWQEAEALQMDYDATRKLKDIRPFSVWHTSVRIHAERGIPCLSKDEQHAMQWNQANWKFSRHPQASSLHRQRKMGTLICNPPNGESPLDEKLRSTS